MIEPIVLNSRGKDMLCLIEYSSIENRGKKLVLLRHGFCGDMSVTHRLMTNFSHRLTAEGYTVVRFDSVGAGASEGDCSYMTVPGEIEDLRLVISYIKENIRPEKMLMLGYSLGGLEAAVCAKEADPDGLILWSPCSNAYNCIRYILGDELFFKGMEGCDISFGGDRIGSEFFESIESEELNPISCLEGFDKPVYLLHGTADDEVFPLNSQIYLDYIQQAELEMIEGANHSYDEPEHQEELWERTIRHIKEVLG